ncbi:MAG: PLP-dependent aminotransferase family protein [Thermotogae bacterium]|nr:PLP-dependent aminotransferase family protein [Thermotogota bacterium]
MDEFDSKYALRAKRMKASLIRELLKMTQNREIISFGGGVPDPETFPINTLKRIAYDVIEKEYATALQYGTTEGDRLFRENLVRFIAEKDDIRGLDVDSVLVATGSQQALDLIGRIFIDEGDIILVEGPTYLGALSAFNINGPRYITIPLKDNGIDIDYLENKLKELEESGELKRVKFLYTIPNFHNPAGVTMGLEERKKVIEFARRYDFLIIEDDPYGLLRYEGERIPSIFKLGDGERTLLLNTFSKILSPGLRLGTIIGEKEVIRKIVLAKQGADLCTPTITQRIAARYLETNEIMENIRATRDKYSKKLKTMLNSLEEYMPKEDSISWTHPQGGLFLWMRLPDYLDTMQFFDEAVNEYKVAYIPGSAFYADGSGKNTMRLSFCLPSESEIIEGIKRLSKLIKKYMR